MATTISPSSAIGVASTLSSSPDAMPASFIESPRTVSVYIGSSSATSSGIITYSPRTMSPVSVGTPHGTRPS